MRRTTGFAVCVSVFLFGSVCCYSSWILASRAAEAPSGELSGSVASASNEAREGEEREDPGPATFPFEKFEQMFNQLAKDMGLDDTAATGKLSAAMEKLFSGLPTTALESEKSLPHTRSGLLKKLIASRMQRQGGKKELDMNAFSQEFEKAMRIIGDFGAGAGGGPGPTAALQQLSQLTQTALSPDGADNLKQYLGRAAVLLKELLPGLPEASGVGDDEL